MKSDEDYEFERIEIEYKLKSSGMDCCTYDCIQGRDCPVRKKQWKNLSDKEILIAYGWSDIEAATILLRQYKEKILENLRNVEKSIREKNT
jgi:hypothetical protein